ncbi:hypothetical protein J8L98_11295 [Pseudoalteromonas sp. MMG013]|uniref:hypothetical protein n=1 Tax=Pseudoalteromonas sp. MMG013 TaxID=2822687 RepID=UPI001B37B15E|nr:hypothetical protein [Pseudoalteromonas sp. MMG013]MBQ4862273.1 hypothetical protein [Pseudoalteromonas sp. MMG013]
MLKLKKKLLNHEVVVSLCFSIYGVFLHFNPEFINESKIRILYFLTPVFFVYFIFSLVFSFKSYSHVVLDKDYLSLDDEEIKMKELEFVNVYIFYSFESMGWVRKVKVFYKYVDGRYCDFSGFYKLNMDYKELLDFYSDNKKVIIEKNSR